MASPYVVKQEKGQVICLLDSDSEPGDVAELVDLSELDDSRSGFPSLDGPLCGKPAARRRSRSRSPRATPPVKVERLEEAPPRRFSCLPPAPDDGVPPTPARAKNNPPKGSPPGKASRAASPASPAKGSAASPPKSAAKSPKGKGQKASPPVAPVAAPTADAEAIESAWRSGGLKCGNDNEIVVREVLPDEKELRRTVRILVQEGICTDKKLLKLYEDDYIEVFETDPAYRVLAAFVDRKGDGTDLELVGGLAFKMLPSKSSARSIYLEFCGTKLGTHCGKPLVKQLKQWVRKHPTLRFICLSSLKPSSMGEASLHTAMFWSERGFQRLDCLSLMAVSSALQRDSAKKTTKPLTEAQFMSRFKVPEGSDTTILMVWVPTASREL